MDETSFNSTHNFTVDKCKPNADSKFYNLDPLFMTYYYGIFGFIMVVNLTGNFLVLMTMYRHRSLWTPSNLFISNLAVSDFLFGIFYPTYNVAGINRPEVTEYLGELGTDVLSFRAPV